MQINKYISTDISTEAFQKTDEKSSKASVLSANICLFYFHMKFHIQANF